MREIPQQKPGVPWKDESGVSIPYDRLTKLERDREKLTAAIARKAAKVSDELAELKQYLVDKCTEAWEAYLLEYKGDKAAHKGNFTFHNFDRSIRIEVNVSEPIKFDDPIIQIAKQKLDAFLQDGITSTNDFIKEIVLGAFETRRGQMDVDKVLGLKRYTDRINDERYTECMNLIDKAIRKPTSKRYYRISLRNDKGEYIPVSLDLASL